MVQLTAGFLALLAVLTALANQSAAGTTDARLPATGWELERDVEIPSYAVTEIASTNLNIESVVL
jgi:hypothetical protein